MFNTSPPRKKNTHTNDSKGVANLLHACPQHQRKKMWFDLPQVHGVLQICRNMKLHPVYLHFPDWQFDSYFFFFSLDSIGDGAWSILFEFCLVNSAILFGGGGQIGGSYVTSTCYIFLSSPPLNKKGQNVLQGGAGQKPKKYVLSTCYLFPPQFFKILLTWGGGETKK